MMKKGRTVMGSAIFRLVCQLFLLLAIIPASFVVVVNGQETNSINTTSYALSASHRTNFCPLHSLTEAGVVPLEDALRGRKINVGLFRYQLDRIEDDDGVVQFRINDLNPGAGILFLDALAARAGFTWRDSFGILDSPDGTANETWDGLLRWSVDTYDLVGDWFLRRIDRLGEGIVFPEGWYDGSLIMVRRRPEYAQHNFWAFTLPFTWELWCLVIGTVIASGLVYYLLDYMNTAGRCGGSKKKTELNLMESMYFSCMGFTGHLIHLPKTMAPQILVFSMCFLFLLITSAYTANLASFLVVRNTPSIIITDITDAIRNDLSFCVLKSSTSETTLVTEYSAAKIIQRDSIADTYRSVVDGECDIVLTTVGTWRTYERNAQRNVGCSLEWVGRVVKPFSAGFSLRDSVQLCSSIFRDILSLHMVQMKLDRADILIWDQIINERATISCLANGQESGSGSGNDEDDYKLSLDNLGGIFIAHAIATTIALGLATFMWFRHRQSRSTDDGGKSGQPYSALEVVVSTPKSPNNETDHQISEKADNPTDHPQEDHNSHAGCKFRPTLRESICIPMSRSSDDGHANEANHSSSPKQYHHNKEWFAVTLMMSAVVVLWTVLFVLIYV